MSEDLELRLYRPGDEAAILETFNQVFREVCGEGYVDREMAFWNWEFRDCPFGHRISVAMAPDGRCAAQYAGVVYPMHTSLGPANFVHIVDSMTHPDFRKGLKKPGLFVTTAEPWFEHCHAEGDAVLYGYPVPIAERIGQRYLEYHRLRVVDYLCREAGEGSVEVPAGIGVEQVAQVPAEVDDLFARMAADKHCLTRRDQQFLNWRYVQPPGQDYEIYTLRRAGALCGLFVLRPIHELAPGSCSFADWVIPAADLEAADAALAVATARARELGRQRVMAIFADPSPEAAHLRGKGFAVVPSKEFMERRLTHRIYHPQMTTPWLQEHWWYTLGDSDLI